LLNACHWLAESGQRHIGDLTRPIPWLRLESGAVKYHIRSILI
jgi:hypothetical protein